MAQEVEDGMTERLIFPADKELAEAISEYWHDERLRSRADAIRKLIQAGLAAEKKRPKHK